MTVSSTNEGQYLAMSGSALLKNGAGTLRKIICTTSSTAILTIYDNTAASGTKIIDSLTLVAGTVYEIGALAIAGIYVHLDSGSGKWTAIYN